MGLDNLIAIAKATNQRTSEKRQAIKEKYRPSAWRMTWADVIRKYYPECMLDYTAADAANLKRAIANRGLPAADVSPLLEWTVANWQMLRAKVFSRNPKVPRGPEFPIMRFVIVNLAEIHGMYTAQKPEVRATLPLASRIHREPQPGAAAPAPALRKIPLIKPAQQAMPAPSRIIDSGKAEAARIKLGLPKWEDKP